MCCVSTAFNKGTIKTSSTVIYPDPPTITAPSSQDFDINIKIKDVTDLFAWQAWLEWDPQILDFVDFAEGDFLKSSGDTQWGYLVNQTEGWILVWGWLSPEFPGVSGSGILSTITFHGISLGEFTLDLHDTKLIDSSPESITPPPYLGDANGDRVVDAHDAYDLANAFGTSLGHPQYDPDTDFNGDDTVDLFDLLCIAFNFGNMYPEDNALEPVEIAHEDFDGYVTIYERVHNIDTGFDYATIQAAIDAPETLDGHRIFVDAGTYREHVTVHKSVSLVGESRWNTIIDGNGTGTVVSINSHDVTITGFTVQNSGSLDFYDTGIGINSDYNTVSKNIFRNCMHGTVIAGDLNSLSMNIIENNNNMGIYLLESWNTTITRNDIANNGWDGITLDHSINNFISKNTITNNTEAGINDMSDSNTIIENTIANNYLGVYIMGSANIIYHNNLIDNLRNAWVLGNNTWDNGYPSGGNYWSDYVGNDTLSGPNQDQPGSDGIGDIPYIFVETGIDYYPLMEPWEEELTPQDETVIDEVIVPDELTTDLIAFKWPEPLQERDVITPSVTEPGHEYVVEPNRTVSFYWVNDCPYAMFAHDTRYVFVDEETLEYEVMVEEWPPALNDIELWEVSEEYWNTEYWIHSTEVNESNNDSLMSQEFSRLAGLSESWTPPARNLESQSAKRALIIQGHDPTGSGKNATELWYNLMINFGYSDLDIIYLAPTERQKTDAVCTKDNVLSNMESLSNTLNPGDELIVFIFAHGELGADMHNGSIILNNWRTRLHDWELQQSLSQIRKGVNITVIIESCYSGSFMDNLWLIENVKFIITSTDWKSVCYTASRGLDPPINFEHIADLTGDPNPWDEGGEFSSGLIDALDDLRERFTTGQITVPELYIIAFKKALENDAGYINGGKLANFFNDQTKKPKPLLKTEFFECDFNFDRNVTLDDLYIFSQAWQTYPGHPRWNPIADLDRNGFVALVNDLYIFAQRWYAHYDAQY